MDKNVWWKCAITAVIQQEKQKEPITDTRLAGAIAKIKTGEFTLEKLHRNFTLTETQTRVLNEQVAQ